MRRVPVIIISVLVLGILFMVLCTFVQRPYEDVLLDRFGKVVEPVPLAGNWKLCLPTDSVVRFDRRLHLQQSFLSQLNVGGESLSVRTYVAWHISDPKLFYNRMAGSDKTAEAFLTQKVNGTVEQQLARMSVSDLFSANPERKVQIEDVENGILKLINDQLKGTEQEPGAGMEVLQLGFSRMAFPPMVAQSVYGRMVAERQTKANRLRDEGQMESTRLKAEGQLQRDNILAEAKAAVGPLKGKADAEAVTILAKAQGTPEAQDFYQFVKAMDLFRSSLGKNSYLVLPSNSPLMEYFLNPPTRVSATQPAASK